ncbi:plasmid replication protein, CyRepA1 family [Leptolyngbya sp. ST-U4]|uniref:plasmid replication protein, CyRepA1 family n=1 Tax=Leptolyngbya sp. ST-U4 TaxID=2933912 RepID=UPI00329896F9
MNISSIGARSSSSPQGFASQNLSLSKRSEENNAKSQPPISLEQFRESIAQEFIHGSAIDPVLFSATVRVVPDLIYERGEVLETPIHDALNWKYTRFWINKPIATVAALLLNEDYSCWQAKLGQPRVDPKGKGCKYETPVGNGSRAFLPDLPPAIRQRIADRYRVEVPLDGSFWDWLSDHPELPIVWTEGGKKALALLSLGYVAIALYGVNGGYSKDALGDRALIADVLRFCQTGRPHVLAFDQDAEDKTRQRVNVALSRFGGLLHQTNGTVAIAQWSGKDGKGIDDLIVSCGAEAWEKANAEALPLEHWRIWQQLSQQLTWTPAIRLQTADLSTLDLQRLPAEGLIALCSPKGTGKTKWIAGQVEGLERVLSAGHRRSLQRSLSQRLKLDYIGDLDKANGEFISGSAYTLRVSFVVDSLLAIDPDKFRGCDLVIDEVVQVIRHLLTSSTCAKDGKRPALLARFRQLIRVARRVIVADADLDNATLHYLKALREDANPVFLIRNDYQPQGYAVRMLQCPDRTAIMADLLEDISTIESGKVLFVATDSKATSKALARTIQQQFPGLRVLVINSETSGGEIERSFIQQPDAVLEQGEFDVIICSPSMSTGVSIETQGIIARVYGIFGGVSATDADMAQALGRVREPVERVVWCAKRGSNYSKASRSTNSLELKAHLQSRTSATVSLIRSSLREDVPDLRTYDWQADPHLDLYCRIAAAQNRSMLHLREALIVRLRFEGNQITIENRESNGGIGELLKIARDELRQLDAESIMAADDLTVSEVLQLEAQESVSPEQQRSIAKFYLKEFYCLEELTVEDVLADKEGRRRGELRSLEELLYPGVAVDRTVKALDNQLKWNQSLCPWDISSAALRQALRERLKLTDFLDPHKEWTKYDLYGYACKAREWAAQIKQALSLTITENMSDVQIIHQLLSQLGIKIDFRWSRSVPGHEGEKLRVYCLHQFSWQESIAILDRRTAKRDRATADGSPLLLSNARPAGDPSPHFAPALEEESFNQSYSPAQPLPQMTNEIAIQEEQRRSETQVTTNSPQSVL